MEPCLTAVITVTSLLRPLFLAPGKTTLHFFVRKPLLIRSLVNTANFFGPLVTVLMGSPPKCTFEHIILTYLQWIAIKGRLFLYNFTLNNSNHVLSKSWQVRQKKWCTTVQKSESLNLFQNNHVNSFSLLFCSLQFKFSVHLFELSVHDTCIPSSFCLFVYFRLISW